MVLRVPQIAHDGECRECPYDYDIVAILDRNCNAVCIHSSHFSFMTKSLVDNNFVSEKIKDLVIFIINECRDQILLVFLAWIHS